MNLSNQKSNKHWFLLCFIKLFPIINWMIVIISVKPNINMKKDEIFRIQILNSDSTIFLIAFIVFPLMCLSTSCEIWSCCQNQMTKKGLPAVEAKFEVINHQAVLTHKKNAEKKRKEAGGSKSKSVAKNSFYSLQLCFHYYQLYARGLFLMTLFLVFIKA